VSASTVDDALRGVEAHIDAMASELRELRESAKLLERFTHAQQCILLDMRAAVDDRQTDAATLEEDLRADCDRLYASLVAELRAAAMRGAA